MCPGCRELAALQVAVSKQNASLHMTHKRESRVLKMALVPQTDDPHPPCSRREFFDVPQAYDYRTKPRTPLEPSLIERAGRLVCAHK